MNLPLDVIMMIAKTGGPILQYKLSICSHGLHQRMKRVWYHQPSPIRKSQFIAKKFPAPNWHLDTCDGETFKNAHPSIADHLLSFLEQEILSGRISSRDPKETPVELMENAHQQCLISHLHKEDHSTSIDSNYRRILQFNGMGGNAWSFWLYRDESNMCGVYNISHRATQSTSYRFDPAFLLDFETYDFFDCKNVIVLGSEGSEDKVVQINRYHLVIRFDRLNRWIKAYATYYSVYPWETLSPEEKAKYRPLHYEKSLQKVLNELKDVCKLDSRCIQVDREKHEIHVTFEL